MLTQAGDIAIVVGGYNSSNTSHLVELCLEKFPTYFIQDDKEIHSKSEISHYDLHRKEVQTTTNYLPSSSPKKIVLTSGASCPDATVDRVIQKLVSFFPESKSIDTVLNNLTL